MASKPRKEQPEDAVIALLERLPRVQVSENGPYTVVDRARDFLAVFGGASDAEQGQRVLAQIGVICDPAPKMSDADKPGTLAMKAGMRRVMAEIMLCMVAKAPLKIETQPEGK